MLRAFFFCFFSSILLGLLSCSGKDTLFKTVDSKRSGIHFNNAIQETDTINVLDYENVYNGGGVGIGDFNNDGLQDIYFTGNLVSNKLYLNKGNFTFTDVTEKAAVDGNGRWCRGASVVDINNDGWQDIYVSTSIKENAIERANLLYINQGVDKGGIPHFKEMAAQYGLNDTTHSTMAAFFDYDNDSDLDVYVLVNEIIDDDFPNSFRPRKIEGEHPSTGRLYRNDWNDTLKHPVFTNVSKKSGITVEGYGHGVAIADINKDGWKDIYVSNDYLSSNILYINNGDGTFTDKVTSYFKHTAANAMGNDIIDINNDGLQDVIEVDMNPEDNYRKKMMMNANSYQTYQNSDYYNYQYQYVRNVLQLNQGPTVNENDSIGVPIFSDISFFAGIAETDWSWTPLVTDFDNDGFRDIIITNGFPKDVTDHDFVAFRNDAFAVASKKQLLEQIPEVKLHNYGFHNNGNLTFSNVTDKWGLTAATFSNGAAYADFDNDGDLDVVINNINDEASLYENTLRNEDSKEVNFLALKFNGNDFNRDGFGAWVEIAYSGKKQVYEHTPYRGYLSSVQKNPHFGLGNIVAIDSLVVKWPNGKKQVIRKITANRTIELDIKNAGEEYSWKDEQNSFPQLFTEVTSSWGDSVNHEEIDFIDFNIQKLIPHKFSEYGPALAVGDVNGDGLEDIVIGGSFSNSGKVLLQQPNGKFLQKALLPDASMFTKRWEDLGVTLFDAEGDKDLDIYIASGGYENESNTTAYEDKLYLNDGKGNFVINPTALPRNLTSKSCVRAADYDKDGDLDLFLAGRVDPWKYPQPVSSFIYRNDSQNGQPRFTDVTGKIASTLQKIGLVCDAVWTDFDGDGWQDLMLAGEWMPVTFLKNVGGRFTNVTAASGVSDKRGWWTSLMPGDFDNDGDMDYLAGNLGLNSFYRGNEKHPVTIYAKDFDNNGSYDAIPTLYLPISQQNGEKKEYVAHTRDDMAKQLIVFRSKFQNYRSYANATFDKMFTPEELKGSLVLKANYFENSFLKNEGNGKFSLTPLPLNTQYSCLNGMLAEDFNKDGNLDVLISGNDYGTEVSVGRYDACNGVVLKGDGKGGFNPMSILESGWFLPGNGKALVKFKNGSNQTFIAASQNRGPLKVFKVKKKTNTLPVEPADVSAVIYYKNGNSQKREMNYGASFLSQSGRFLNVDETMSAVEIKDNKGKVRKVNL